MHLKKDFPGKRFWYAHRWPPYVMKKFLILEYLSIQQCWHGVDPNCASFSGKAGAVWINYVDLVEYYLKVGRYRG
jgi:hypothetical protein